MLYKNKNKEWNGNKIYNLKLKKNKTKKVKNKIK